MEFHEHINGLGVVELQNIVLQRLPTDPTTLPNKNPFYFNTSINKMKYWTGSIWVIVDSNVGTGTNVVKGVTSVTFNNSFEEKAIIEFQTNSQSNIITNIDVENDEILVENFETQVVRTDDSFTIICRPKLGRHTGTVNIKYTII